MFNKICTMMAKSAPYPPCTVTAFWLKYRDPARCLRRVTQPPHIAGPLAVMRLRNNMTANAQARVWQPIPATVPKLPNTCFFAGLKELDILQIINLE